MKKLFFIMLVMLSSKGFSCDYTIEYSEEQMREIEEKSQEFILLKNRVGDLFEKLSCLTMNDGKVFTDNFQEFFNTVCQIHEKYKTLHNSLENEPIDVTMMAISNFLVSLLVDVSESCCRLKEKCDEEAKSINNDRETFQLNEFFKKLREINMVY